MNKNMYRLCSGLYIRQKVIGSKFIATQATKPPIFTKWINYWKGLCRDYAETIISVVKAGKEKPIRTTCLGVIGFGLYECAIRNPTEEDFLKQFRIASNNMVLISPALQNPISVEYIKRLQMDLNQSRLRFLSLGVLTIMWEDLYDKDDCTYPATCQYTKVSFWNFYDRIIDVGFWNTFWNFKWKLRNYDVNYI